ncbi:MAG TPA: glycosyltransferase [Candidatus Saccharimonadales bacterium]|nr:glycosyltransferase [Candidatus Saccharimonadales bacterium]
MKTTPHTPELDKTSFMQNTASKSLLLLNGLMAMVYFYAITFMFDHGNVVLFSLLILGEVFHLFQIIGYCYTVWSDRLTAKFKRNFAKPVDIFITVCGEPKDIVRETAQAVLRMHYPGTFQVYLLNDGLVAKKDNWKEMEELAEELGIHCITRTVPGGAKAGNINNGLAQTKSPYFVVFDADHIPHEDFLSEVMGYFVDPKMGFVQTPQFYSNQNENFVTKIAWQQQTLFFGPIMSGKNRLNSAFMCGTNMAISRKAIKQAGGMCEFNIAEDFLTSLFIHEKGWKSVYVPKVLAEGLAPEDFLSYYKQQFRWTRGSLEVIFKYNPLFRRGLKLKQKLQYLISASYYLSGAVVFIDALLPILFLFTGVTAIITDTMTLALVFIPYIFLNLYTLQRTSNFAYSFEAIAFSLSSFWLQINAIIAVLTNQKTSFVVTSKTAVQGNFLKLVIPQIIYILLTISGTAVGVMREGVSASLLANLAWALVNVAVFIPFVYAAAPKRKPRKSAVKKVHPARLRAIRLSQIDRKAMKLSGAEK